MSRNYLSWIVGRYDTGAGWEGPGGDDDLNPLIQDKQHCQTSPGVEDDLYLMHCTVACYPRALFNMFIPTKRAHYSQLCQQEQVSTFTMFSDPHWRRRGGDVEY